MECHPECNAAKRNEIEGSAAMKQIPRLRGVPCLPAGRRSAQNDNANVTTSDIVTLSFSRTARAMRLFFYGRLKPIRVGLYIFSL